VLERLWTATVWGQPAAIVLGATTSLLWRNEQAAALGWVAGAAIAYILTALLQSGCALWRALRPTTTILLVALAVEHIALWSHQMADRAGWIIDAILVIGAAVIQMMGRVTPSSSGTMYTTP
jgi:hypothetical protein